MDLGNSFEETEGRIQAGRMSGFCLHPIGCRLAAAHPDQTDIGIAEADGRIGARLSGKPQAKHGFIQFPQHRVLRADHCHMIDLREHRLLSRL